MRIQHNIIAMNAYRNYSANTSAMQKNLERLSSGYKINRAGDDAAGLAISEKMRAQITGLEAASKNAKDGISLVQTAEGALTEVHDMLNRMVELATMSANGTYNSETDRTQLQKELDQLRSEIDRIADSANFNGIKLLDGSMDGETMKIASEARVGDVNFKTSDTDTKGFLAAYDKTKSAYDDLGKYTVLHKESGGTIDKTSFGVALHNFEFSAQENDTFTITLGEGGGSNKSGITITLKVLEGQSSVDEKGGPKPLTGGDLASAIKDALTDPAGNGKFAVYINQKEADIKADTTGDLAITDAGDLKIQGAKFTVKADGDVLTFTSADGEDATKVQAAMGVTINGVTAATFAEYTIAIDPTKFVAGDKIVINGKELTLVDEAAAGDGTVLTDADLVAFFETNKTEVSNYELSYEDGKLTVKATKEGELGGLEVSVEALTQSAGVSNEKEGVKAEKQTWTINISGEANWSGAITLTAKAGGSITDQEGTLTVGTSGKQTFKVGTASYTATYDAEKGTITIEADVAAENNATLDFTATPNSDGGGTASIDSGTSTTGKAEKKASVDIDVEGWSSGSLTIKNADAKKNFSITYDAVKDEDPFEFEYDGKAYVAKLAGNTLTIEQKVGDDITDANFKAIFNNNVEFKNTAPTLTANGSDGVNAVKFGHGTNNLVGDYNRETVEPQVAGTTGGDRLASTSFDLTMEMVQDGSKLRIGNTTYVFSSDKDYEVDDGEVLVDLSDLTDLRKAIDEAEDDEAAETAQDTYLAAVASRLSYTAKAEGNEVYSVGANGTSKITIVEQVDWANQSKDDEENGFDLTTQEGIAKSVGFEIASAEVEKKPQEGAEALTLQIGDTAEKWNQLAVNIKDTHCKSLGQDLETVKDSKGNVSYIMHDDTTLKDISIENQNDAATAIDVIKRAINQVSDIRGTLGATQNRLDHTLNNLSVMTENIQDAESTIRDTDVAEEMMAYTKNNILIQAAQAMLAQANQIPQGVLQLLQ